ncbi:3'-5' exonuclease [Undibacterium sp.]|uniref:3'-5' exonuclease n=1 Tax=Undibacterium sp. TaxID=1914977 RepID=UPI002C8106C2|nr:3'-5' exonuclease [Undibacterium sp.]HTD02633.1 3'-5' exonuclease [Undibacterium sp.]
MTINTDANLPPYPGIQPDDVLLVLSQADMDQAFTILAAADVLGFDTESKPTFLKGQDSGGPHLIQLATDTRAFLFPVLRLGNLDAVKAILESGSILKVGFGLSEDTRRLQSRLGIQVANVLDLSRAMREVKRNDMGAKAAVAKYFGLKLQKSKKTSTSNWAAAELSERQLKYAADDAQVALLVYRTWLATRQRQDQTVLSDASTAE